MGRKCILDHNPTEGFYISFRGEEEVKLLQDFRQKAHAFDFPLRAFIIAAMTEFTQETTTIKEFKNGKKTIVLESKHTITNAFLKELVKIKKEQQLELQYQQECKAIKEAEREDKDRKVVK
jgi:hypothetical protein